MAFHGFLLYLYYLCFLSDLHIFATNLATELIQKLSKSIYFHNSAHIFRFLLYKGFFSYQYLAGTSERLDVFIHVVEVIVDLLNLKFNMVQHSQEPRPTCWWKWVGRTKGVKSGISTLTVNISAKFQCFDQSGAFFGTAHAWIFRIRWENEKKFTNIVAGAPRVSSPSFARFFPQFRQDLFGFVTYGFLTVHLSDLFHLSIRGVLQLRNVVLMCISSFI